MYSKKIDHRFLAEYYVDMVISDQMKEIGFNHYLMIAFSRSNGAGELKRVFNRILSLNHKNISSLLFGNAKFISNQQWECDLEIPKLNHIPPHLNNDSIIYEEKIKSKRPFRTIGSSLNLHQDLMIPGKSFALTKRVKVLFRPLSAQDYNIETSFLIPHLIIKC